MSAVGFFPYMLGPKYCNLSVCCPDFHKNRNTSGEKDDIFFPYFPLNPSHVSVRPPASICQEHQRLQYLSYIHTQRRKGQCVFMSSHLVSSSSPFFFSALDGLGRTQIDCRWRSSSVMAFLAYKCIYMMIDNKCASVESMTALSCFSVASSIEIYSIFSIFSTAQRRALLYLKFWKLVLDNCQQLFDKYPAIHQMVAEAGTARG